MRKRALSFNGPAHGVLLERALRFLPRRALRAPAASRDAGASIAQIRGATVTAKNGRLQLPLPDAKWGEGPTKL